MYGYYLKMSEGEKMTVHPFCIMFLPCSLRQDEKVFYLFKCRRYCNVKELIY